MSGTEHDEAVDRKRATPPRSAADPVAGTPDTILALQRSAGNQAVSQAFTQGKLGPWLREHAQPALEALAALDFGAALSSLNGFSTDDIVAVLRAAGGPKRAALGKYIEGGSVGGVDVPRFVMALRMAGGSAAAAARAEHLHDLIRGGELVEAYELLNGLAVGDQERALAMLDKSHLQELVDGLGAAAGVDVPWLATLLSGVRGVAVTTAMTSFEWLNGQEAAAGAEWAAGQPDDRLAFMLRPRTLKAAGQVRAERIRAMLTAGQVRRLGGDVEPAQAAKVEAAMAGAQLSADQRNAIRDYLGIPAPTLPEATVEPAAADLATGKGFNAPSTALEQSTQNLFGLSYAELLGTLQTVHAFGVKATVHPAMAAALMRADALAREKIATTEGRAMETSDWRVADMSGLQAPPSGFHSFGLAVDINYRTMPYLMNEGAGSKKEAPLDRRLALIYHRISWLMLGRASTIPKGPWSYSALAPESDAMREYFALRGNPAALKARLDTRDDAALKGIFGDSVPAAGDRAAELRRLIDADHDQLTAAPETNLELPPDKNGKRATMDSPFDPKKGHPDPSEGFLSIRKEIVEALKESDPAMRWGGTDFGLETGDLMHFDLGKGISRDKSGVFSRKHP